MANRKYLLYYDTDTRNIYNETGAELSSRILPYIFAKEQVDFELHYVKDWIDANTITPYTGFTGVSISSSAVIDNDYNHVDAGTLVDATLSGAITSIEVSGLTNTPLQAGFIQLVNQAGESETVAHTAVTTNGSNFVFTVSTTLTYSYVAGDESNASDPALIKTTDIDETDKDTGIFIITMDANSLPYLRAIEGSSAITGCRFEHQVKDADPKLIFNAQFSIICNNTLDDDGVIPPPADGNYYTKSEVDALIADKMDKVPTATAGNLPVFNALGGMEDSGLTPEGAPPIENNYLNDTAMFADQINQTADYIQQSNDVFYQYLGTTTGSLLDYRAVGGGSGGSGDVTGPSSSADGNVVGFDGATGKEIKDLGFKLEKNTDFGLIEFTTDDGCELKLAYDDVIPFYNESTTETITAGTVLHLTAGVLVGSQVLAVFEKADASDWEKIQGTVGFATCDVLPETQGFVARKGQFKDIDTSSVSAGSQLWISATTAGTFTDIKPQFPNYSISIGGSVTSAVNGEILANVTSSVYDTFHDAWDGAIRETFDFRVDSTSNVILGTLKNVDTSSNLTLLLSDGLYTLDTTTSDLAIQLTAGTDEVVQTNYVYIPIETKVLTVSLVGFPSTEHCKIAVIDCQSASDIEAKGGARGNQNTNDHLKKESDNGHILHIAEWIRRQYAIVDPRDGCEVTLDDTAGDGYLTMTSGKISQMHLQTIDSIAMPASSVMIANDPDTAFVETSNLNTITKFSDGSAWNNWGKIVVWVIANKGGEPSFLMVNLPRKGENSSEKAMLDEKQRANYSIPAEYKSKAVLLGAFAVEIAGGVLTYDDDYQDLRGTIPSNIAGGGGGGGVTSFLGLSDVPSSYVGQAGKKVVVNGAETALEFTDDTSGGSALWDSKNTFIADFTIDEATDQNKWFISNATAERTITTDPDALDKFNFWVSSDVAYDVVIAGGVGDVLDNTSATGSTINISSTDDHGVCECFNSASSFDRVSVVIKRQGSPTGSGYIRVYAITGTIGTDAKPTGSPIAESTFSATSDISETLTETEFILDSVVSSGDVAVAIEYTAEGTPNYLQIDRSTASTMTGNCSILNSSDVWAFSSNDTDLAFKTSLAETIDGSTTHTVSKDNSNPVQFIKDASDYKAFYYEESAGGSTVQTMIVQDQKSSGTDAGSSVAGNQIRTLNTVVINEITGASLSANQITLPVGEYLINARCPSYKSTANKCSLVRVSGDAFTSVIGSSVVGINYSDSTINNARVTVSSGLVFEVHHWIQTVRASNGLGYTTNNGNIDVYSEVIIKKIG